MGHVPATRGTSTRQRRRLGGPNRFDTGVLLLLAGLSVALLALLVWRAYRYDLSWTGVDGLNVLDQMQYLAWIREASGHVLTSNPYELGPSSHSFLHPGIALSGALTALGITPSLAYLIWKPVAVVSLFLAVRAFVRHNVEGVWPQRVALALALFAAPLFSAVATKIPGLSLERQLDARYLGQDLWPVFWLWGYPFAALAVAALATGLLAYARDRHEGRLRALAPSLALLCSWLQPWQGATLLGVLVLAEVVAPKEGRSPRLLAACVAAGAAPLVYYGLLGQLDPSWALAAEANKSERPLSATTLVLLLLPLAIPAALAYRRPPTDFVRGALMAWPPVGLGVFALINYFGVGTYAPHALQGLGIPLAALATLGLTRSKPALPRGFRAAVAVSAVGALIVLPVTLELNRARDTVFPGAPYMLEAGDRAALRFLEADPRGGGVLAPVHIGLMIPAKTQRPTWVGALSWTPEFRERARIAHQLFGAPNRQLTTLGLPPLSGGRLSRSESAAVVRGTRTRFVLADCASSVDLERALGQLVASARRFGCAKVLELR